MRNDPLLGRLWQANAAAFGIEDMGLDPSSGSTDMANVSWVCPAIHPDLSITPLPTAGHTIAFREAAATPYADRTTLIAATIVAQTAFDLLADPSLIDAAWRGFRGEADVDAEAEAEAV